MPEGLKYQYRVVPPPTTKEEFLEQMNFPQPVKPDAIIFNDIAFNGGKVFGGRLCNKIITSGQPINTKVFEELEIL